jgi:peptidoglycan-binding protein ArfA
MPHRGGAHWRSFWPWLVPALVAVGAMGWWANRHTHRETAPLIAPVTAPARPVGIVAPPAVPRAEPEPAVAPAPAAPAPAAPAPVVAVPRALPGRSKSRRSKVSGDLPQRFVMQGLEFQTNSAALLPVTTRVLDDIVNVMTANPAVAISAEGHTDDTGFPDDNLALSTDRANAVKDYLVSQGVAADRITTTGLASLQPIAPNDTPEGRAINRRTEIVLLQR